MTLAYFKGKIVTVLTTEVNFKFKFEQMNDYFTGFLEEVQENYVIIKHFQTGCKTYIAMSHIIAIAEEQVLNEDNPEEKKIIEDYRKEKPITAAKTAIPQKIDPKALAEMAKKAKQLATSS